MENSSCMVTWLLMVKFSIPGMPSNSLRIVSLCLTCLIIIEMKIKFKMMYHYMPVRMGII